MKKKVYRIFINFIDSQEKWLNKMAIKGYRLKKVTKWSFEFETCKPAEYTYKVEFVADKSLKDLEKYRSLLNDLNIKSFNKNLNIGKYSFGEVCIRPYGTKKGIIATSPGNINSELLILEKKNDGKSFEISPNYNIIEYYKKIRTALLIPNIMFILFLCINYRIDAMSAMEIFIQMIFGICILLLSVGIIKYSRLIKSYKKTQKRL